MTNSSYEEIPGYSRKDAAEAVRRNDPAELRIVVLSVSLYARNRNFAEQFCENLACHSDEVVRGNSILGFGHLARRFRESDADRVKPIIEAGLTDKSQYVRSHAWSAAEDVNRFLGWEVSGFKP